jgi:hydrogenase nickel incorporation protein HypA/HybF
MHELSVANEIINIASQYLPDNSGRVKIIKLKIGTLSNILVDSLIYCYEAAVKNTLLHDSTLVIERAPIIINCKNCLEEILLDVIDNVCPNCGSIDIEVTGGDEMQIVEIELYDKPEE